MFKMLTILATLPLLVACENDADIASRNLSKAADMFEVNRRVVFYLDLMLVRNTISDYPTM